MTVSLLDALDVSAKSREANTRGFLHFVESHIEYLKRDNTLRYLELDKSAVYHSLEDVYTFQRRMRIPREHWWINMRLNDMYHPNDFTDDITIFMAISDATYNWLYSGYVSNQRRI